MAVTKVRRPHYAVLFFRRSREIDFNALFEGKAKATWITRPFVATGLDAEEHLLSQEEREVFERLPGGDVPVQKIPGEKMDTVQRLVNRGVLVADGWGSADVQARFDRDRELRRGRWTRYAALAFAQSRWAGVVADCELTPACMTDREQRRRAQELEKQLKQAPPTHDFRHAVDYEPLPEPADDADTFHALLRARRSAPAFDANARRKLPGSALAAILKSVWGAQGEKKVSRNLTLLSKSSASPGALTSVEIYMVVAKVKGMQPGLYHFNAVSHEVGLLKRMTPAAIKKFIRRSAASQTHYDNACVYFFPAARFERLFWKYFSHAKMLEAIHIEVGLQLQSLQLLATANHAASRITIAVNNADIDEVIGLDPAKQSVVAMCAYGFPAEEG